MMRSIVPSTSIGAATRLTEAQKADPAVQRALNDTTVGGALIGSGIAAMLSYDSAHELADNKLAIVGAAALLLGASMVFASRRTEKAA